MAETMTKKQLENSEIQTGACHYVVRQIRSGCSSHIKTV